jgi:hypothetical protein
MEPEHLIPEVAYMTRPLSDHEVEDRSIQGLALGLFLISVSYAIGALDHLLTADLGLASDVVALVGGGITLWNSARMRRASRATGHKGFSFDSDSFVMQSFQRACVAGFLLGFMTLTVLKLLDDRTLAGLQPEFFMQTTLAVMLGSVGIKFYWLNREPQDA